LTYNVAEHIMMKIKYFRGYITEVAMIKSKSTALKG